MCAQHSPPKIWNVEFPICHRRPDRSFFFRGRQFPVCARCTGIALGFITLPLFAFKIWSIGLGWALLLHLPTYLDGMSQATGRRESNNRLRLVTGFLCGLGQMAIVAIVGDFIAEKFNLANLFH